MSTTVTCNNCHSEFAAIKRQCPHCKQQRINWCPSEDEILERAAACRQSWDEHERIRRIVDDASRHSEQIVSEGFRDGVDVFEVGGRPARRNKKAEG